MDGIKTKISIDKEVSNGERGIYFDEILSHHAGEKELQEILKRARISAWKSDEKEGQELGTHLFHIFNGSGGKLSEMIKNLTTEGNLCIFSSRYRLSLMPCLLNSYSINTSYN